ncbi:Type IV pili component [Candidatus Terasakiella magnetica]|nr:Type IV pili component [Candidatus Terasakiella magnetica]
MTKLNVCLALLLLTACAADLSEHDYRISKPVTAEEKIAVAVFDRPAEGEGLSPYDLDRLTRLGGESHRRGAGPVHVTAAAGHDEAAARSFAETLAARLRDGGAAVIEIRVVAGDEASATVQVPMWSAVVPECGTFKRGLNPDYDNAPNSNWGCAVQRNRALMMQNPADLVRARPSTGRDAVRAGDVLGKYGRGEPSSSAAEEGTSGSTSSVGTK